jgi:hypothetical protein
MSSQLKLNHAVMEGKGSYNKHGKLPAEGATLALPLLERAIKGIDVAGEEPIVVADYGSSQGRNSLAPMRTAINGLRRRVGPSRAISVFHVDQPSNDFNSLFEVLDADPDRYVADDPEVYPAAIGKSFYEKVLPPGSVHIGWSSYAAVWLSQVPAAIPGHFISVCSNGEVREAFNRQAAKDWETFLTLRARELRPQGRLLVVLPGIGHDGRSEFELLFDHANVVLEELVADGMIAKEERSRMAIGSHLRRKRDLLAPFEGNRKLEGLSLEDFMMSALPDAVWAQYERDRDKEALATKRALFFRSVFVPSLASALSAARVGEVAAVGTFGDQLERRLKQRLAGQPAPMHSWVQTILLAKES